MTREKAVSIIEERVHAAEYVESGYVDCVDIEALMIAIKALTQPEIIRCKDCKYWDVSGYCVDFMTQDENGFCSWAERRTDETN